MSRNFEKYAHDLALAAATGRREPLVALAHPFIKSANPTLSELLKDPTVQRYLIGGLGGAGLGAVIGSLQPGRRVRKALNYGLMGGLGGLGLAHLLAATPPTETASDNPQVAPPGALSRTATDVAQTAAHLPPALVTPMKDLPRFQQTGNPLLDFSGIVAQGIRDKIPRINEQSPLATAIGSGAGLAGGRYLGNHARRGIQAGMDRWNAAALARATNKATAAAPLTGMSVATLTAPQVRRNARWSRAGRGFGGLANLAVTAGGLLAGTVSPSGYSRENLQALSDISE